VSYNSIDSYTACLHDVLTKPTRRTRRSESATPKATTASSRPASCRSRTSSTAPSGRSASSAGERPLHALREGGVEYVEVRAMDLDPFSPIGITADTVRFLDVFLLHCLLTESPPDSRQEVEAIGATSCAPLRAAASPAAARPRRQVGGAARVGLRGARRMRADRSGPGFGARRHRVPQRARSRRQGGGQSRVAALGARPRRDARAARNSYSRFGLARSLEHAKILRSEPLPAEIEARFARLAEESVRKQKEIEAADRVDFETYRQKYLSHESLRV